MHKISGILLIVSMSSLSGCGTLNSERLANRLSCTMDGKGALISSMYGPIGLTSKVNQKDAVVICAQAAATAEYMKKP